MVPGVVGRRSSAAAPAGPLRIAHCTGQHRRPQLVDAVTPRRTAVGSVSLPSQSPRGVGECRPLSDPLVPFPATVSLRIAGDWRADHARDVVDTEPKMTKALLIARGGFIPDENRILRPADRPGRPPLLRPVGADQSRDEVRAASWG